MLPWLEQARRSLRTRFDEGRLGHAPLIHGPAGIGKQELGDWLARLLLCREPVEAGACGDCQSCQLVASGAHPDLFVIDVLEDKQGIAVDQVRGLIEGLQLTASMGKNRVGLMPRADAMNRNAANALLKTLEEPPPGAWLILLSEQPARLPATIRSRCQQLALRVPEREPAESWLAGQCPESSRGDRDAALELGGGAPLAALQMLESGGLDAGLSLLEDLATGTAHGELIERWQAEPAACWQWLARWMAVLMAQASRAGGWRPEGQRLPPVPPGRDVARLWQMALDGHREAERGVVRQDLLLGRWLLEWEACQPARK
ncbi:MAG: DNA polymerase III subunit delta' [Gammaproteobacteria bacterium]|jgi:DNA polymerase-3 subunit delta'|nr:DNA polymerase III subunit delta' [Gammaproteobacteria bacterium]